VCQYEALTILNSSKCVAQGNAVVDAERHRHRNTVADLFERHSDVVREDGSPRTRSVHCAFVGDRPPYR
jgi:hypothetical protein